MREQQVVLAVAVQETLAAALVHQALQLKQELAQLHFMEMLVALVDLVAAIMVQAAEVVVLAQLEHPQVLMLVEQAALA